MIFVRFVKGWLLYVKCSFHFHQINPLYVYLYIILHTSSKQSVYILILQNSSPLQTDELSELMKRYEKEKEKILIAMMKAPESPKYVLFVVNFRLIFKCLNYLQNQCCGEKRAFTQITSFNKVNYFNCLKIIHPFSEVKLLQQDI